MVGKTLIIFVLLTGGLAQAAIKMAITFDDLPRHGALPPNTTRKEVVAKILAVLKNENIPEVYGFINAKKLEVSPEEISVLKLWRSYGYPLGNHTYSHPDLTTHSATFFNGEIDKNEKVLSNMSDGTNWHYFRYPFLHEGDTLEKRNSVRNHLSNLGYKIAQVTIDFGDWAWNNPYGRCVTKNDGKSVALLKRTFVESAISQLEDAKVLSQALFQRLIPQILLLHVGSMDAGKCFKM